MASQLLGLQAGIPLKDGHPIWYRRMRLERLKKQKTKHLQVISDNNPTQIDLDSMERTMPARSAQLVEQQKQNPDPTNNDKCSKKEAS